METKETAATLHNKRAPYWAAVMLLSAFAGISTVYVDWGSFWNGYMLDAGGPAWNYILFRGLFTYKVENAWARFFTPVRTVMIFSMVCISIELLQYFEVYSAA